MRSVRPSRVGRFDRQPAGGEREEVRRDRLRLGEAHARARRRRRRDRAPRAFAECGPAGGHVERERDARLQVGLIEARERLVRTGRHEKRVQEVVLPVERHVASREVNRDLVLARREPVRRHDEVAVHDRGRRRTAGNGHAADLRGRRREIDRERTAGVGEPQADLHAALDRLPFPLGNDEREAISHVRDSPRAIRRERCGNAGLGIDTTSRWSRDNQSSSRQHSRRGSTRHSHPTRRPLQSGTAELRTRLPPQWHGPCSKSRAGGQTR